MALKTFTALETITGAAAASNGFVVLARGVAKGEVVHGALSCREHTERTEEQVAQRLRHLHVAGHNSCGGSGVEHRTQRHHQIKRSKTALIQWNVTRHQRADDIEHSGLGHRQRGIEIA